MASCTGPRPGELASGRQDSLKVAGLYGLRGLSYSIYQSCPVSSGTVEIFHPSSTRLWVVARSNQCFNLLRGQGTPHHFTC